MLPSQFAASQILCFTTFLPFRFSPVRFLPTTPSGRRPPHLVNCPTASDASPTGKPQVMPSNWADPATAFDKTLAAVQLSVKRLGFDYVDLMLLHAPGSSDGRAEAWRALEQAYKQVRDIVKMGQLSRSCVNLAYYGFWSRCGFWLRVPQMQQVARFVQHALRPLSSISGLVNTHKLPPPTLPQSNPLPPLSPPRLHTTTHLLSNPT